MMYLNNYLYSIISSEVKYSVLTNFMNSIIYQVSLIRIKFLEIYTSNVSKISIRVSELISAFLETKITLTTTWDTLHIFVSSLLLITY